MAKKKIDYTNFSPQGPVESRETLNSRWWTLSQTDMPAAIAGVIKHIQDNQTAVETQRQVSAKLYGNLSATPISGLGRAKVSPPLTRERVSYNVVQSSIDTVVAKIAKNKPRPMFLTSGGEWKLQRRAEKLDKFVEGVFYANDAHAEGPQILRDSMVYGTGITHVFAHNKQVAHERVLCSELFIDEVEAFYGKPRQMHRVKNVDRLVLADMFPSYKTDIMSVNGALDEGIGNYQSVGDPVTVAESWHLRSGPEATDGLHTITINSRTLFKEEWKHDFFPFAFLHWAPRMYGFWAQGAAEQIQNIQLEINKILWVIQRSMHLAGTFKVWVHSGGKIVKEHINNDIGSIISSAEPPQYLLPPIIQPEVYQHLQTLRASAYEQLGVSELSASSKKPEGLDSGKALREYNDIESDRFQIVGQAYERYFLDLAKLDVAVAKEIFEQEGSLKVKVPGKRFIDTIDWKDVSLEDDQYSLKLYPISSLPNDPEGRLATIQEYAQAGFLSPPAARRLLDFPDLDQAEKLSSAPEDRIHKILEDIIDDGKYEAPDQYLPLDLARTLALQYYNHGVVANLEEPRLEMLRTFMDQVDALQQEMNAPAMPPPGDPSSLPSGAPGAAIAPANPQATPTSNLIPNVNAA